MRIAAFAAIVSASLSASQAVAATLVLEIETVEASENSAFRKPGIMINFTPSTRAAIESFERQRIGEQVTLRIGDEKLITSTVTEPIFQGTLIIGGGHLTYDVLRDIERHLKSGQRKLFLDGSDKQR
jgi:hypothetical protein